MHMRQHVERATRNSANVDYAFAKTRDARSRDRTGLRLALHAQLFRDLSDIDRQLHKVACVFDDVRRVHAA